MENWMLYLLVAVIIAFFMCNKEESENFYWGWPYRAGHRCRHGYCPHNRYWRGSWW